MEKLHLEGVDAGVKEEEMEGATLSFGNCRGDGDFCITKSCLEFR